MSSPDKLFRLDPVSTDLTSPVTQVQIQKAADDSRETKQLYTGLQTFGKALGTAATYAKQRRIHEDTKLAENAALRNEVLPGGLLPIAVESYNNIVDLNTSNSIYDELDLWSEGDEGEKLVSSNELPTDAKLSSLDNILDDYWTRASSTIQNPSVLLKFKTKLDAKKIELKKDIFKVEKDLKTVDLIQAVQNTIKDAIKFMKLTGITDFNQTFSPYWIKAMSKDIKNIFPDIDPSENKLLILQTLSTNPDVLSNPSVIIDIMKSEYNKGITYNTLYAKGKLASNKDADATELVKIFDNFITNSNTHLKAIEDAETAHELALKDESYNTAWDEFHKNPRDIENAVDVLKRYGRPGKEITTFRTEVEKYQNNEVKHQIGSSAYLALRDLILDHTIRTEPQLNKSILSAFLASDTKGPLKDFLSEEGKQITKNVQIYKDRVKTLDSTAISSMKGFLRKDVSTVDLHKTASDMSTKELISLINPDSTIKPEDLRTVLIGINELRFDIQRQAEQLARQDAALEGPGEVTKEGLEKIQQAMNSGLDAIIKGITLGKTLGGIPEGKLELGELPKLKVPRILSLPSLAPKDDKELDERIEFFIGEFTQLDEPTDSPKIEIELTQDDVNEIQKILVQDQKEAKKIIKQLEVYESKLKREHLKLKADPKDSKLKKETTQEAKEKLIVDAPISKQDQEFLDQLKAGKSPTGTKQKEAPQVKTRAELLQENPEAAKRLKLADKDREQKTVEEKPPLLESDQKIANKQALFDHLDANQVPSKQQWTDLVEGLVKKQARKDKKPEKLVLGKPTGGVTTEGRLEFTNNFGGTSTEYTIGVTNPKINNGELTHIPSIYNGKIVSQKEAEQIIIDNNGYDPETGRLITPGGDPEERSKSIEVIKEQDKKDKSSILDDISSAFFNLTDMIFGSEEPLVSEEPTKKVKTRAELLKENPEAALRLALSDKDLPETESVKLRAGATAIKEGVKSVANMDFRILDFTKGFFDDPNLSDVWGLEKMLTSGGRTDDPESGHFDDGINKVVAIDVRNRGWKGTPNDLLLDKLGPSAKKRGWVINPTKEGKTYTQRKKEYWMKLSKGKEIRFIEVTDDHIHYHIDINHKEPKNKW